ncbi:MAG: hypothetical protein IPI85_15515 [Dehalococcoidia bacterium]|nr:hypothetical protein [Dehalococcoidia bacterium]
MFNGKLKAELTEMTEDRDFWIATAGELRGVLRITQGELTEMTEDRDYWRTEAKKQNEVLQTLRRKMVDRKLAHEAELAKVSGKGQPVLMADWPALRKWRVTPWDGPVEFVTAHAIVHDLTTGWAMFYRKEPTSVTTLSSLYVPAQPTEYCVAQYKNLASIVEAEE